MKRVITILIIAALVLSGCQAAVTGTPVEEPVKLDCDLIFPGPGAA